MVGADVGFAEGLREEAERVIGFARWCCLEGIRPQMGRCGSGPRPTGGVTVMSEKMVWRIFGASDDLIEVECGRTYQPDYDAVNVTPEEFGAYSSDDYAGRLLIGILLGDGEGSEGRPVVKVGEGRIVPLAVIHAIYDGCWAFAFGLYDEDVVPEAWKARVVGFREHSVVLEVTAPDCDGLVLTQEQ